MISSVAVMSFLFCSSLQPAFLDGDVGLYTTRALFGKPGELSLNIKQSIGTMRDRQSNETSLSNQICGNLHYAPLSRLAFNIGGSLYSTQDEERSSSFYANVKIPLLTFGRITSSLAPSLTFLSGEHTYLGANAYLDIIPFASEHLPPFLFSNSFSFLHGSAHDLYQLSSLLTFHNTLFTPFVEFYSEYHDRIDMESSYNSRMSTGLGLSHTPFFFRAGVEIPFVDLSKRDFDFRFTTEFGITFIARRTPRASVFISVADASNDEPLDATITITGKEVQEVLQCAAGQCVISDLVAGLYTIQIAHPGYKNIKAPLFVKDKTLEKVFKLIKIEEEKGGGLPENE
jgi:hypothetical protein